MAPPKNGMTHLPEPGQNEYLLPKDINRCNRQISACNWQVLFHYLNSLYLSREQWLLNFPVLVVLLQHDRKIISQSEIKIAGTISRNLIYFIFPFPVKGSENKYLSFYFPKLEKLMLISHFNSSHWDIWNCMLTSRTVIGELFYNFPFTSRLKKCCLLGYDKKKTCML